MTDKLHDYLKSGKHLPKKMRDFHDQKDLFKSIHALYIEDHERRSKTQMMPKMPNWVTGHIYVIDWFLWFMASRGYTLQKSKKKGMDFLEWPDYRELSRKE